MGEDEVLAEYLLIEIKGGNQVIHWNGYFLVMGCIKINHGKNCSFGEKNRGGG